MFQIKRSRGLRHLALGLSLSLLLFHGFNFNVHAEEAEVLPDGVSPSEQNSTETDLPRLSDEQKSDLAHTLREISQRKIIETDRNEQGQRRFLLEDGAQLIELQLPPSLDASKDEGDAATPPKPQNQVSRHISGEGIEELGRVYAAKVLEPAEPLRPEQDGLTQIVPVEIQLKSLSLNTEVLPQFWAQAGLQDAVELYYKQNLGLNPVKSAINRVIFLPVYKHYRYQNVDIYVPWRLEAFLYIEAEAKSPS